MSASGFTPISLYYSTTASAVPTAANLVPGELAINTNDGKLYYEDSSGVVQVLATKSTGSIGGSNTQVQFNNSGSLGGSSGLTWDGSFLTTSSIKNSALTSGRVTYAGASGLLTDSANLLYSGTDLIVYGVRVGRGAGASATNTAVGASALNANTTGIDNTALGDSALLLNLTGTQNTAIGRVALANTTASFNTGLGFYALALNTSGASNTAVGVSALQSNTTASNNTAVGYQAGYLNTGANNVYVGALAASPATGDNNVAIGYYAGGENNIGSSNVLIGNAAGQKSTGTQQTFVGQGAGYLVTTGGKNTILGRYNGNQDSLDIRTASNYIVLSDGDGNRQITMAEGQTLALDSAVPNAGTGITFPATQSASSDANTLDDYEEGTWTPTMIALTGTFTTTSITTATYTKIGRMVAIQAKCSPTSIGTGADGFQLTNLPFTSSPTNAFAIAGKNISNDATFNGYIEASGTTMRFAVTMINTHTYMINGTYFV